MPEASPAQKGEQERPRWTVADVLTGVRLPLALAFLLAGSATARLVVLGLAAASDLLDGPLARRYGSSALGAVLDPIADKLFVACAFGVVAFSGALEPYEILGVLLRDIVAAFAFLAAAALGGPGPIPARFGGKVVTAFQMVTLLAFLVESPLLRPLAWVTAALGVYAIWDYGRAARRAKRPVGR